MLPRLCPDRSAITAVFDQAGFFFVRVVVRFHFPVVHVPDPTHEMVHCALRAVAIENFEGVSPLRHILLDSLQGRGFGEQTNGLYIAIHPRSEKIVVGRIADVEDGVGDTFVHVDERIGPAWAVPRSIVVSGEGNERRENDASGGP